jgi:hypothetical protein
MMVDKYNMSPDFLYKSNGRTLCKSCHLKTDTYAGKALSYVA